MKKATGVLLVIFMLMTMLCGCGGSGSGSGNNGAPAIKQYLKDAYGLDAEFENTVVGGFIELREVAKNVKTVEDMKSFAKETHEFFGEFFNRLDPFRSIQSERFENATDDAEKQEWLTALLASSPPLAYAELSSSVLLNGGEGGFEHAVNAVNEMAETWLDIKDVWITLD